MKTARMAVRDFDLAATLDSGQAFHWEAVEDGFEGVIDRTPVRIFPKEKHLEVTPGAEDAVRGYFSLDHDLREIARSFPEDPAMREAVRFCRGIRILRQPLWECLATFITSAQKQVSHIRQMSKTLRMRYGEPVLFSDRQLWIYPTPEALAAAGEAALRECALGYRAKHLWGAAKMVAEGVVNLENIRSMDDARARVELMRLPGVGEKVANCVLLFAYERLRAFPVDVWIGRILRSLYFARKRKVTAARIRDFSAVYFGDYGGYAQQYLFHYARKHWKSGIPEEVRRAY